MNVFSMKNVFSAFVIIAVTLPVQAQSVKDELKEKLTALQPFSANFEQTVVSAEGEKLLTAQGDMQLQRPNKFRWNTTAPDEQLIISDGETLWFYNPFVEQVSIYTLTDAIANTPFMLLAGNEKASWDQYRVTKLKDEYRVVTPNDESAVAFSVSFSGNHIATFTVEESQGQSSSFILSDYTNLKSNNAALFDFKVPENTDIDDQR